MPLPNHLPPLTPEERRRRLAALLATGLLRLGSVLKAATSPPVSHAEKPTESSPNRLAVPPEQSVTVSAG